MHEMKLYFFGIRLLVLGSMFLIMGVVFYLGLSSNALVNGLALRLIHDSPELRTDTISQDSSRSAQLLYLLGLATFQRGNFSDSITILESPDAQQRKPLSQWLLVRALARSNQTLRAATLLGEMDLAPDTLINLASNLQPQQDTELIHMLAEQALHEGGGSVATKRWLGLWSIANGELTQAVELIESILTDNDDYLWSQLGWSYYLLQDYENSVLAFSHAVDLKPEAALYRLRLAQAHQARNQGDDRLIAQQILKTLVTENPDADAETWYTLGWNHYLAGQSTDAIMVLDKVVDMTSGLALYRLRLAQALVQRGQSEDLDRAVSILSQLVLEEPDLSEAANLLSSLEKQ